MLIAHFIKYGFNESPCNTMLWFALLLHSFRVELEMPPGGNNELSQEEARAKVLIYF